MPQNKWQKSSFSSSADECVEVRVVDRTVELRESECGHIIARTSPLKFANLLDCIKAGEFDHHAA
ncbi:DUF397 domain-containing protein [Kitasatospora sp. NPDC057541]|uniref:DUF397 domain-containing protein n=1 Tax=unclassified Kitasatospora TaxID=2633591 RepID=UPI0036A23CCF